MMMMAFAFASFAAEAVMVVAMMFGTLPAKTFPAKAVMMMALAFGSFAAEAMMVVAMMFGTLPAKTFPAKAVMVEAMMMMALAFRSLAAEAVMVVAMMFGTLPAKTFAAKAVMAEAAMLPFSALEAVMFETVSRETLLIGAVVFSLVPGKGLMFRMAGTLRFLTLLSGGVSGARLSIALMAGARLRAIGMMGTMHRGSHYVFADFHRDLLLLRLADDREGRRAIFAGHADQNLKLPGIDDLLIVIELQNVETLETGRSRRAVGQNGFHH
jgi:hypothetical protein